MIKENNMHLVSKEELNNSSAADFQDGDVVICKKYYIHIHFAGGTPRFKTRVNTREDLRDLPAYKQPLYIRSFIDRPKTGKLEGTFV